MIHLSSDTFHPLTGGLWPECAKCGGPVQRVATWEDPSARASVWTVECHGERETVRVSWINLQEMESLRIARAFRMRGVAFEEPKDEPKGA